MSPRFDPWLSAVGTHTQKEEEERELVPPDSAYPALSLCWLLFVQTLSEYLHWKSRRLEANLLKTNYLCNEQVHPCLDIWNVLLLIQ